MQRLSAVLEESSTDTYEEEFKDESKEEEERGEKEIEDDDDDIQEIKVIRNVKPKKTKDTPILKEVKQQQLILASEAKESKIKVAKEEKDVALNEPKQITKALISEGKDDKEEVKRETKIINLNLKKEDPKTKKSDPDAKFSFREIKGLRDGIKQEDGKKEQIKKEITLSKTGYLQGKKIAIKVIEIKKPKEEK